VTSEGEFNSIEAFRRPEGGVLLVDKPGGWTSFDVVRKLRRAFGIRKIGHAGTLDPLATGLLILASGGRTRDIASFQDQAKTYDGTLRLGAITDSLDADTPERDPRPFHDVTREALEAACSNFRGAIMQTPPMYSAVKIRGTRLYALARAGRVVERAPRPVEVFEFSCIRFVPPDVDVRVVCSKGTYVRVLAHDLGAALGCGAYLTALRRVRIGPYAVTDAWTVQRILDAVRSTASPVSDTSRAHLPA
jgi:tRNA pseudouridine55 synthase